MNYLYISVITVVSIGTCGCENNSPKELYEEGNFKKCFEFANSINSSNSDNFETFYYSALSAKAMGEYCLALEKFYVCEKLDPFDIELKNIILETEGFATYSRCSFKEQWVEERFWMSKNFASDYYSKYQELLERNSYDSAKIILKQLLRMGPDDSSVHNLFGLYFEEIEQYDSSIFYLNKSIDLRSNSCVLLCNRGRVLITVGKIQEGIDDYEKALLLCPDSCLIYEGYVRSLKSENRIDLAKIIEEKSAIMGCVP